eukprot:Hpha_TRINITY_DN16683_c0_g2::TRINITY_DN16683_c0_g2_i1::g.182261::m.182261
MACLQTFCLTSCVSRTLVPLALCSTRVVEKCGTLTKTFDHRDQAEHATKKAELSAVAYEISPALPNDLSFWDQKKERTYVERSSCVDSDRTTQLNARSKLQFVKTKK